MWRALTHPQISGDGEMSRPSASVFLACAVITLMFIASLFVFEDSSAEHFATGETLCEGLDDLDIDMPRRKSLLHFAVERGDRIVDVQKCGQKTFTNDQSTWRGPASSGIIGWDAFAVFVTLAGRREDREVESDQTLLLLKGDHPDPSDTRGSATVRLSVHRDDSGTSKLRGTHGSTEVEMDYFDRSNTSVPISHFLQVDDHEITIGFFDIFSGIPQSVSAPITERLLNTSASPLVVQRAGFGKILSVAIYASPVTRTFLQETIRGICVHAMQEQPIFSTLVRKARELLASKFSPPSG